ncbi:UPF0450 protein C17orf58 homolog isoform X2 [Bombina bombina]|nr:UPF0450 protein C17orf58 homolog isoform X2 [Bombina bombina]
MEHQTRPIDERKFILPPDKRKKNKIIVDNNTGMRRTKLQQTDMLTGSTNTNVHLTSQAFHGNSRIFQQSRLQLGSTSVSTYFYQGSQQNKKASIRAGSQRLKDPINSRTNSDVTDYESNRPGKVNSYKYLEIVQNFSIPSRISNRNPSSLLYQFNAFKKDSDSKEKDCLTECNKEKDERESYCNSEFALNGIVHDLETLSKGTQLITLLVNSAGLYKMNRLYITPDGFFFRVKILAVDTSNCNKSCLDFKLGSRYIVMGQIYHKWMELPLTTQQLISGRLRSGDGLVRSSSYIKRFNRKKDSKVLMAIHAKCR